MSDLFLQQETARVQHHFDRVEKVLLQKDINELPDDIKVNRQNHIQTLHDYAQAGIFPQNYDYPGKQMPCFIDEENRPCAVAHLMMTSGEENLARKISEMDNYAFVPEIAEWRLNEVEEWVKQSGFSFEELTMIQPSYEFMYQTPVQPPKRLTKINQTEKSKSDKPESEFSETSTGMSSPLTQNSDAADPRQTTESKPENK